VDVILHDRDARPGIMFADWELIGVPLRVTLGDRGLKEGVVEIQARRNGTLLVTADVQVCTVHAATFKPTRLSPSLRDLLQKALH
jgi:prolyl-tRNA synthetase